MSKDQNNEGVFREKISVVFSDRLFKAVQKEGHQASLKFFQKDGGASLTDRVCRRGAGRQVEISFYQDARSKSKVPQNVTRPFPRVLARKQGLKASLTTVVINSSCPSSLDGKLLRYNTTPARLISCDVGRSPTTNRTLYQLFVADRSADMRVTQGNRQYALSSAGNPCAKPPNRGRPNSKPRRSGPPRPPRQRRFPKRNYKTKADMGGTGSGEGSGSAKT